MPPPATGPGEWKEPCAVEASGVAPWSAARRRIRAAREQELDDVAVAPPRARVQRGAARCARPVDRQTELEQDLDGRGPALGRRLVQRLGELGPHPLGARGVGRREPLRALAVAGEAEADQLVDRADLAPRAELGEHLAEVRPAHPPREPVRRTLVLLVPGVRVRAGGDQHPQHLRRAAAVDRPQQRALDLVARLVVEQEPQHLRPLGVEAVRDRVRALDARARVEQEAQAGVVAGLGRVVDGLVVVRVRARLEQQRGHPRLVRDARGAVERAERAELGVLPARVRVGAGVEQRPRAGDEPAGPLAAEERGVARVEQRQPVARAARPRREARGRAPAPRAPARRRRGRAPCRSAAEVGVEREQRLGVVEAPVRWPPPRAAAPGPRARPPRPRRAARAAASSPRRARERSRAGRREPHVVVARRRSRASAVASPARAACSSRFASRRARSRSIRPSIADHLTCRPRSALPGRGRSEHEIPLRSSRWAWGPARGPGCALVRAADATRAGARRQAPAAHRPGRNADNRRMRRFALAVLAAFAVSRPRGARRDLRAARRQGLHRPQRRHLDAALHRPGRQGRRGVRRVHQVVRRQRVRLQRRPRGRRPPDAPHLDPGRLRHPRADHPARDRPRRGRPVPALAQPPHRGGRRARLHPPAGRDEPGQQRLQRVRPQRPLARPEPLDRRLPQRLAPLRADPPRRPARRHRRQAPRPAPPADPGRRAATSRRPRSRSCGCRRPRARPRSPPTRRAPTGPAAPTSTGSAPTSTRASPTSTSSSASTPSSAASRSCSASGRCGAATTPASSSACSAGSARTRACRCSSTTRASAPTARSASRATRARATRSAPRCAARATSRGL